MTIQRGFTLIEMAIVLVIVTILIGGLAMPLSAQIQARRIAETRHAMEAIHDALLGYAMAHTGTCSCTYASATLGALLATHSCPTAFPCPPTNPTGLATLNQNNYRHYLPCPYDPSDTTVTLGNEGARDTDGLCVVPRGELPWRTLGMDNADAWGQRYTYAVTQEFADNDTRFISTPPPTIGTLQVHADASCGVPGVAHQVAAVIVSHGPNGRGAQNKNGGTPLVATAFPTNAQDERHNLPAPTAVAPCTNNDFVSRAPDQNFDDLVIWLSPNALFSRVCPAGGCL